MLWENSTIEPICRITITYQTPVFLPLIKVHSSGKEIPLFKACNTGKNLPLGANLTDFKRNIVQFTSAYISVISLAHDTQLMQTLVKLIIGLSVLQR